MTTDVEPDAVVAARAMQDLITAAENMRLTPMDKNRRRRQAWLALGLALDRLYTIFEQEDDGT